MLLNINFSFSSFNMFDTVCLATVLASLTFNLFAYLIWWKPARELQDSEAYSDVWNDINNCKNGDEFKSVYSEITQNKFREKLFEIWCYAVARRLDQMKKVTHVYDLEEEHPALLTDTKADTEFSLCPPPVVRNENTMLIPNHTQSDEFNSFIRIVYAILDTYEQSLLNGILLKENNMQASKIVLN